MADAARKGFGAMNAALNREVERTSSASPAANRDARRVTRGIRGALRCKSQEF
jgi:hypothetical protein